MSDMRTAAQQALEALHNIEWHGSAGAWMLDDCKVENAIHALRAALAEPEDDALTAAYMLGRHDSKWCPIPMQERNFCTRCGKRTNDIHTCTPPQAEHYCDTHCTWADHAPGCVRADPVQEPVAWRWGYRSITTGEMDWRGYVEIAAHPNLRSPEIIMQPLYTAPPQRKPLTEEEIGIICKKAREDAEAGWSYVPYYMLLAIRGVEQAHGIGEQR